MYYDNTYRYISALPNVHNVRLSVFVYLYIRLSCTSSTLTFITTMYITQKTFDIHEKHMHTRTLAQIGKCPKLQHTERQNLTTIIYCI